VPLASVWVGSSTIVDPLTSGLSVKFVMLRLSLTMLLGTNDGSEGLPLNMNNCASRLTICVLLPPLDKLMVEVIASATLVLTVKTKLS